MVQMATYRNIRQVPARFELWIRPESRPILFDVPPDGTCEGPAGYHEFFAREGLVPVALPLAEPPSPIPSDPPAPLPDLDAFTAPTQPGKRKRR